MMRLIDASRSIWQRFVRDESGTASLEFVLVFPVFFGFFLMTYESGLVSARHVMLERGVDIAVRDVRIGAVITPDRAWFRERICEVALIIGDCENQLEIELLRRDPMAWSNLPGEVKCVNRGDLTEDNSSIDEVANNQLMFIRACVRIDPYMPTTGLGLVIVEDNNSTSSGGSLALVSTAAFVVEPYMVDSGS